MLMLLRHAGAEAVTVVGGRQGRLALAAKLGAADAVNYLDAGESLTERLGGQAFPLIIEATGSAQSIGNALRLAERGGKLLLLGDYRESRADFRWNQIIHQELTLLGSNASAGAWPEAVGLAVSGGLPLGTLVTHRFPASAFADAFALVRGQQHDVVKVVLEWT
jgi:L-iditol 2-dehydrogenase